MLRLFCLIGLVAVGLAVTGLSRSAPAPGASQVGGPFPAGVVEAAGKIGFVTNVDGGIDALDLESGKVLWQTAAASRPLLAFASRLFAQAAVKDKANSVRVLVFDAGNGKKLLESEPIVLPEWVSVGPALGKSFASSVRLDGADVILCWEAHARYAGGARPTPQIEKAARKDASGAARIDPKTGKVEMLADDKVPPPAIRLPRELAKETSRQYWTGSTWDTKPLIAGDKVAVLAVEEASGRQTLLLKRWDLKTATAQPAVELFKGQALWLQVQPDGRCLFARQAISRDKLPDGDDAWRIFSLETGQQVAKVPFDVAMQQPMVLGQRLYYLVQGEAGKPTGSGIGLTYPRMLKAMDLKTGKVVWEHPVEGYQVIAPPP
jgi:outer membrane protein assembly factor BamB